MLDPCPNPNYTSGSNARLYANPNPNCTPNLALVCSPNPNPDPNLTLTLGELELKIRWMFNPELAVPMFEDVPEVGFGLDWVELGRG